MNMKYKHPENELDINILEDILVPKSEKERIDFEAKIIHLEFISRLNELMRAKKISSKKELAQILGTSQSFVTQLFSGEKLINLRHLALLQRGLNIKYSILPDQYYRLRYGFRESLADQGYREIKINTEGLNCDNKKSA